MYLIHPEIPIEILRIGPLVIRWYSLMYIFGFLYFYWWTRNEIFQGRIVFARNKDLRLSTEILSDILFYVMLGVLIGGRLGYALLYNLKYYFFEDPLAIFRVWEGGMSFHGAFIGAYIGAFTALHVTKKSRLPFTLLDTSDIVLVSVPLGLAFGRFGNFVNGELYGRPTTVPWGMIFPSRPELGHLGAKALPLEQVQSIVETVNLERINNVTYFLINGQEFFQVPRHPSQLYQILLEGILTFILQMFFYYKLPVARYRGFLTGTFLISYGVSRIISEFFREPDLHIGFLAGNWLTAGMLYSTPMIIIGIGLLVYALKKQNSNIIRV